MSPASYQYFLSILARPSVTCSCRRSTHMPPPSGRNSGAFIHDSFGNALNIGILLCFMVGAALWAALSPPPPSVPCTSDNGKSDALLASFASAGCCCALLLSYIYSSLISVDSSQFAACLVRLCLFAVWLFWRSITTTPYLTIAFLCIPMLQTWRLPPILQEKPVLIKVDASTPPTPDSESEAVHVSPTVSNSGFQHNSRKSWKLCRYRTLFVALMPLLFIPALVLYHLSECAWSDNTLLIDLVWNGRAVSAVGNDAISDIGTLSQACITLFVILRAILIDVDIRALQIRAVRAAALQLWYLRLVMLVPLCLDLALLAPPNSGPVPLHLSLWALLAHYALLPTVTAMMISMQQCRHQLQQVYKKELDSAVHTADARRDFLAYILHEIRNPSNALKLGLSEMEAYTRLNPGSGLDDTVPLMQHAFYTMEKIMNSVLDLDKMDSGKFEIELAPMNVHDIVNATLYQVLSRAEQFNIHLTSEVDVGDMLLLGDPFRLAQCLTNFTTNALKFSPHDGSGFVQMKVHIIECVAASTDAEITPVHRADGGSVPTPLSSKQRRPLRHRTDTCGSGPSPIVGMRDVSLAANSQLHESLASIVPESGFMGRQQQPALHITTHEERSSPPAGQMDTKYMADYDAKAYELSDTVRVRFEVHDNGEGIDEADQHMLFAKFVQIAAGRKQKGGGTGLGLCIAKEIVERHGGTVGVISRPNVPCGSIFWMEVPFRMLVAKPSSFTNGQVSMQRLQDAIVRGRLSASDAESDIRPPPLRVHSSRGSSANHTLAFSPSSRSPFSSLQGSVAKSSAELVHVAVCHISAQSTTTNPIDTSRYLAIKSVLVVDDQKTNRTLLSKALRRRLPGTEVLVAEHGEHALEVVQRIGNIDVIIMDREMPICDGQEATRLLRARSYPGTIIGLTGNALPADLQAFRQAGANSVMSKPVDIDKLMHVIEQHIHSDVTSLNATNLLSEDCLAESMINAVYLTDGSLQCPIVVTQRDDEIR